MERTWEQQQHHHLHDTSWEPGLAYPVNDPGLQTKLNCDQTIEFPHFILIIKRRDASCIRAETATREGHHHHQLLVQLRLTLPGYQFPFWRCSKERDVCEWLRLRALRQEMIRRMFEGQLQKPSFTSFSLSPDFFLLPQPVSPHDWLPESVFIFIRFFLLYVYRMSWDDSLFRSKCCRNQFTLKNGEVEMRITRSLPASSPTHNVFTARFGKPLSCDHPMLMPAIDWRLCMICNHNLDHINAFNADVTESRQK